ncbi:MlaC/ttg2D family ABC transporter substrate-binding protein [Thiomicrorhabdus lithotrophica]|uniref:ABC transporter substrate-binding protein n=1 Tax=Thiomicrorhabdus lithotrophica TaxID=2949997 RepID=A0ABY8CGC2_9GAMM|nr:ABC transporter substrate-binding protein [Thiomicrorhabdus lithotrophica]WEJ63198.1 ABC transporter substrate-binding protein [Thiomicrorhabdus lithotrophica]
MRLIRTKSLKLAFIGLLGFVFSVVACAQVETISQDDPEKMVLSVSNKVISELNENRELLESSSADVKVFAIKHVLPYIDTEKMARYVMGKYWRVATDLQKQAFVDAFTNTMIRSYSQSLLKLRIESVEVEKAREEKPGRVTVASKVTQSDGNKSDVIYRVYLNKSTKKWMLYDVAVEGISMLLSYRKAYGSDISKKGLDAVIAEMQEKNSDFNGQVSS